MKCRGGEQSILASSTATRLAQQGLFFSFKPVEFIVLRGIVTLFLQPLEIVLIVLVSVILWPCAVV